MISSRTCLCDYPRKTFLRKASALCLKQILYTAICAVSLPYEEINHRLVTETNNSR